MARDNFSRRTINMLAERVGFLCSNPNCGCHTVGPNEQPLKATRIGTGAHITAASAGGPRFDSSLTAPERSSIANGIWLCCNCSDLIDKDEATFPAPLLRQWKASAELRMSQRIKAAHQINPFGPLQGPYLEADLIRKRSHRAPGPYSDKNPGQMENGIYVIDISHKPIIHWTLGWEFSLVITNNSSFAALNVAVEINTGDIRTIERSTLPSINHIKPFENVKLKITYMEKLESSHVEADEKMLPRIPAGLDGLVIDIYYFDEGRNRHRTRMTVNDQQVSNDKC